MTGEKLQWHPAFQAVLRIELEEELEYLDIRNEQTLNKKPLQIDVLIIKNVKGVPITKNIGRIFKKYNIIEYKSPTDHLSINDFYKVYAYACLYQSNTEHEMEIAPDDITITFVSTRYPRKLLEHLKKKRHFEIENIDNGIYYISGDIFSMQLIVIRQLSKENNFWLKNLRNNIQNTNELQELVERYDGKQYSDIYQSAMDVIVHANWEKMKEVKRMCNALRELFAEELEECKQEGKQQGIEQGIEQGIKQGIALGVKRGRESGVLLAKRVFKLNSEGVSLEQIAAECNISLEYVQEILE